MICSHCNILVVFKHRAPIRYDCICLSEGLAVLSWLVSHLWVLNHDGDESAAGTCFA